MNPSKIKTPGIEELQTQVPYQLHSDLRELEEPYKCAACGQYHRVPGAEHDLFQPDGSRKPTRFCVPCVANGVAISYINRSLKALG